MQLVAQLMARFAPQIMKSRANSKDPMFGELVIPDRLRNFPDGLSSKVAFPTPNQLMTNYASRELSLSRKVSEALVYTVYSGGCFRPQPPPTTWPSPSAEHTAAVAKWATSKQAPKPGSQPLPFHTWALYRLRPMRAADLCAEWIPFSCLTSQLNNLSIILHLSAT